MNSILCLSSSTSSYLLFFTLFWGTRGTPVPTKCYIVFLYHILCRYVFISYIETHCKSIHWTLAVLSIPSFLYRLIIFFYRKLQTYGDNLRWVKSKNISGFVSFMSVVPKWCFLHVEAGTPTPGPEVKHEAPFCFLSTRPLLVTTILHSCRETSFSLSTSRPDGISPAWIWQSKCFHDVISVRLHHRPRSTHKHPCLLSSSHLTNIEHLKFREKKWNSESNLFTSTDAKPIEVTTQSSKYFK